MSPAVFLRGYAAPFNCKVWLPKPGLWESFAPGAFELGSPLSIDARVGHDGLPFASTGYRTLRLFQNARGLAFEAELQPSSPIWGWVPAIRDEALGVSVQFRHNPFDAKLGRFAAIPEAGDEVHVRHENCQISHIALELDPAYEDTILWFSNWEEQPLSHRMAEAIADWNAGPDPSLEPLPLLERKPAARASSAPAKPRPAPSAPPRADVDWDGMEGIWRRRPMASRQCPARPPGEIPGSVTRLLAREPDLQNLSASR